MKKKVGYTEKETEEINQIWFDLEPQTNTNLTVSQPIKEVAKSVKNSSVEQYTGVTESVTRPYIISQQAEIEAVKKVATWSITAIIIAALIGATLWVLAFMFSAVAEFFGSLTLVLNSMLTAFGAAAAAAAKGVEFLAWAVLSVGILILVGRLFWAFLTSKGSAVTAYDTAETQPTGNNFQSPNVNNNGSVSYVVNVGGNQTQYNNGNING